MQQVHHLSTFTLPVVQQASSSPDHGTSSSLHLFHFESLSLNFKQRSRWGRTAALCNSINTFNISTSSFPLPALLVVFSRRITLTADRHSLTLTSTHVLSHLSGFQLMSSQLIADIHVIDLAVRYLAFWITSHPSANSCVYCSLSAASKGAGKPGCALGVVCSRSREGRRNLFV